MGEVDSRMTASHSKDIRQRCLTAFQKLRRIEESDADGYVTCISCGRVMKWSEAQGGHYIGRSCRSTEIEHDNVWPQCPTCNGELHGNVLRYRYRLVKKIGEDRVRRLELMEEATRGSDEALEQLSEKDRQNVMMKRSKGFYAEKRNEINARIIKLTH